MGKEYVLIETGGHCMYCPMLNGSDECILQDEDANYNAESWDDLMNGCPVRKLPEKKEIMKIPERPTMRDFERKGYQAGWNACLDAITGAVRE